MRRFERAAPAFLPLFRRTRSQCLKLAPLRRSSVSPFALRLPDCSTWNTPAEKSPVWVVPFESRALESLTVPLRVSRIEPTGTWRASTSGTKLRPLSPGTERAARATPRDRLARAAPGGTQTNTSPLSGMTFTSLPSTGGGSVGVPAGQPATDRLAVWRAASVAPPENPPQYWSVWRPALSTIAAAPPLAGEVRSAPPSTRKCTDTAELPAGGVREIVAIPGAGQPERPASRARPSNS